MTPKITIDPPLLNSASPWATTLEDIQALYNCPYTGAVTTRTSLLEGFTHDPTIHQHVFFNAGGPAPSKSSSTSITNIDPSANNTDIDKQKTNTNGSSSLNTYGYSPLTLSEYLGIINEIIGQRHLGTSHTQGDQAKPPKPFILSVTGTPDELAMAYALIANAAEMDEDLRLLLELNLSCPNIPHAPPPAYSPTQLLEYLTSITDSKATYRGRMSASSVPLVGLKLPPYTYTQQFTDVVECLRSESARGEDGTSVIDFITCSNTLGNSLVLSSSTTISNSDGDGGEGGKKYTPTLSSATGSGLGGLAGAAIHPLALGNVATFRGLLDQFVETRDILIIGVGGVEDKDGFERMRAVGAGAVGCATALGRFGVDVLEKIVKGS